MYLLYLSPDIHKLLHQMQLLFISFQCLVTASDHITVSYTHLDVYKRQAENLSRMGADITPTDDGMIIHGGKPLHGTEIDSYLDHRVAMSFAVAGLLCDGSLSIKGGDCVKISYPEFYEDLYRLGE